MPPSAAARRLTWPWFAGLPAAIMPSALVLPALSAGGDPQHASILYLGACVAVAVPVPAGAPQTRGAPPGPRGRGGAGGAGGVGRGGRCWGWLHGLGSWDTRRVGTAP